MPAIVSLPPTPPAPRLPGRPIVYGHRGASADAPENTLAAFQLAMEQGADGVELDVWRCRTGEVVVFHDTDCRRICGSPLSITGAGFRELRALDAGAHKGNAFRGERIPLLAEVLDGLPAAIVNVELKGEGLRDGGLVTATVKLIRDLRAEERVILSSFNPSLLARVRVIAPDLPTGLLFDSGQRFWLRNAFAAPLLRVSALHPEAVLCTAQAAAGWRNRGYPLNVWTVDAPGEVERLAGLFVAGIISNVPGRAREELRRVTGR
jgi:glycerophosphoryl diester phosphodiesterase